MKTSNSLFLVFFILIIPCISFSQKEGIDTTATIESFKNVGAFYSMDYSGDYDNLLNQLDDLMVGGNFLGLFNTFECSLFSANGDENNQIFGRNFDNADNDVLISRYSPPAGYRSLAFTRMTDMGFAVGTNYGNLSFYEKLPLLLSAYFVPDGINEYGLACGLASVDAVQTVIDPEKDTIFVTRLIREILDQAQTVNEALEIANNFNVFDNGVNTISHHVLVGTPDGESMVLEYHNGVFQAVEPNQCWQVLTNIPVWNVPHPQLMNDCWRYNSLYTILDENTGMMSWSEGINALKDVHLNCPWSAIYDMTNLAVYIAVHNNYEDIAFVNLDDFEFLVYVGISDVPLMNKEAEISNFPNPFFNSTNIHYLVYETSKVHMAIYNSNGKMIKRLVNEQKQKGQYTALWSAQDQFGKNVQPGLYFCKLSYEGHQSITKLLLIE